MFSSFNMMRAIVVLTLIHLCLATQAHAQRLTTELVTGNVSRPTWAGMAPGDPSRLFIIERTSGLIKIFKDGAVLPTPFLDISGNLRARVDGGFMCMAFHPDFVNNRWFYIYFTNSNGDGVVERYTVSNNPDRADPASRLEIIKILRNPLDDLHAGGFIGFSPTDGYFYISTGDGGPQGDPNNNSQNRGLLLGKILRIDVDGGNPYAIPPDNPFVNDPNTRDEIWAIGFRNPWRADFDRVTGDLYVADVGFSRWEEVSYIADGDGGRNYGWAIKEGTECFRPRENCDPSGLLTEPIVEYFHTSTPRRCCVIGGVLYRGNAIPLLKRHYFYSDYCSAEVWSLNFDGNRIVHSLDHSAELRRPDGQRFGAVSSFGVDLEGEMFIVDHLSGIYRVVTAMQLAAPPLVSGQPAQFVITGAAPETVVGVVYSLSGIGYTRVGHLEIELGLRNPVLAGTVRADANGRAALTLNIPPAARGRDIWLQAAHRGNTSNVVKRVVQ